ncbi:hypothetical protein ACLBWX_22405 [Methylobacterium sp. M6A4_1b]
MGRKLNPLEGDPFTEGDASIPGKERSVSSSSLNIQTQIAEALGLPVSAFDLSGDRNGNAQEACDEDQAAEIAMSRDCLDLIKAYTRISDPDERQRLLKIVRDAADKDAR